MDGKKRNEYEYAGLEKVGMGWERGGQGKLTFVVFWNTLCSSFERSLILASTSQVLTKRKLEFEKARKAGLIRPLQGNNLR